MGSVYWFGDINNSVLEEVGVKALSLAKLYRLKFNVPAGFIIKADAFKQFLEETKLLPKIEKLYEEADINSAEQLNKTYEEIKRLISKATMREAMVDEILEAYESLDIDPKNLDATRLIETTEPHVALRASALFLDFDEFLSDKKTVVLYVRGKQRLFDEIKNFWADLFKPEIMMFRKSHDIGINAVGIVVQRMVDANRSGTALSTNPFNNEDEILIKAWSGFNISQSVKSDVYRVDKKSLAPKEIAVNQQPFAYVKDIESDEIIRRELSQESSKKQKISDNDIKVISLEIRKIEDHFEKPQQVFWCFEGDKLYLLETRPIQTGVKEDDEVVEIDEMMQSFGDYDKQEESEKGVESEENHNYIIKCCNKIASVLRGKYVKLFERTPTGGFEEIINELKTRVEIQFEDELRKVHSIEKKLTDNPGNVSKNDVLFVKDFTAKFLESFQD
ncbi:hypothetical protein D6745_03900 [Candidatus Woesearchaeota archaeon]|nr:MAG: hypothetical protein D6745_03900 [Candidatus Woesearchaeota archaeon]